MKWLRNRLTAPTVTGRQRATAWQAVSLLLEYPDETLLERLPAIRRALVELRADIAEPLDRFLTMLEDRNLADLQSEYVDTFDVTRKCALHLTYFTTGDTRRRGVALVQFKQVYRQAGVEFDADELPDYLPAVLEFGALTAPDAAWKLLNDHRVGLELLRLGLRRRNSPWLDLVEALRKTLPELDEDDAVALRKLIEKGPPSEDVGLSTEPYGDPELQDRLNPRPLPFPTVREFGLDQESQITEPVEPVPHSLQQGATR